MQMSAADIEVEFNLLNFAGPTTANRCNKSVVHTTAQYKGKSVYIERYVGVIYGPFRPPIYEFYE